MRSFSLRCSSLRNKLLEKEEHKNYGAETESSSEQEVIENEYLEEMKQSLGVKDSGLNSDWDELQGFK